MQSDPKTLWDSFWPVGAVFGAAFSFIFSRRFIFNRQVWNLLFRVGTSVTEDDDREAERKNELARRATARNIDSRTNVELERCYKRIDALEQENEDLRSLWRRDSSLWEGRARRVDEIAHNLRRLLIDERDLLGIKKIEDIPRIPLLEDPL